MENNETYSFADMPIDYLMHHGIKGMKWGIRRYQNKDGSLTAAGRKRYEKLESELNRLGNKPDGKDTARSKKAKDMTDDELRSAISRFRLEDEYNRMYNQLNPAKVHKGKKHMETLLSSAVSGVSEGAKSLIRDALVKKGKDALGLNDKDLDGLNALKKEAEKMGYKSKIAAAESVIAKRAKEKAAEEAEARKAKAEADQERGKSEYYSDPKNWDSPNQDMYKSSPWTPPKEAAETGMRYLTGSVSRSKEPTIIDVEYTEVKSSKPAQLGQRYIAGLLEAPKDDD